MLEAFLTLRALLQRQKRPAWYIAARVALQAWRDNAAARALLRINDLGQDVRAEGVPHINNLGSMRIGNRVTLRSGAVAVELATAPNGFLSIGDDVCIEAGTSIGATGCIKIGHRVKIGAYAMIIDTDFHDVYNRSIRPPPVPVTIDDDVSIGPKACILPGVHVGRGAVIGAGAVVTRDVPAFGVVEGIPARLVKVNQQSPEELP